MKKRLYAPPCCEVESNELELAILQGSVEDTEMIEGGYWES